MEQIDQYTILKNIITFNETIHFWLAEGEEGKQYEILTIRKEAATEKIMKRLIRGEIKPLANEEIVGIQTIRTVTYSEEEQCYFMVYEALEGYEFLCEQTAWANARSLLDIAKGLDLLKKKNRATYVIDFRTLRVNNKGEAKLCFIGLFDLFKQQNLLLSHALAPNVQAWLEDRTKPSPKSQDDMYALIKSFDFVLRDKIGNEGALAILNKSLEEKRINRYSAYHELIAALEQLPIQNHSHEDQRAVKIAILPKFKLDLQDLLNDMNVKTYVKLDETRTGKNKSISGKFSTQHWSGKFIVDPQNYLFIPHFNKERDARLISNKKTFVADFSFNIYPSRYSVVSFFNEKFEALNQLANLNKQKRDLVRQWKTLPDKEREYIEEQAFKAKYKKRQAASNKDNIDFYLTEVDQTTWTQVKKLKRDQVVLFIEHQRVGKIFNYKPKEQIITIADPDCSVEEINPTGLLMEDVRQETSQFKKQVEACDRFKESDVVNPVICDILATPENTAMPYCPMVDEEEMGAFDKHIFNPDIKGDPTQKEAVLEALAYKPLYLIQGPPGTGKTTVIVELLQQILRKQKDAKILVTSQSNLAVDNVLEKVEAINHERKDPLLFMRLASDASLEKDSIKAVIQPHTFENKLKNWVAETVKKSEENLALSFPKANKNKDLQRLYDDFIQKDWNGFTNQLRMSANYLKRLFEKVDTAKAAKKIFEKELGKKFIELRNIQKDWISFLGGVTTDDGKNRKRSMLNDGSTEVDFLTAMMREVNIIGATCIHIASASYNKINFRFDYVIMDESSKASPPETLVPINMGQNIILIGDHKQLPPVVTREDAVKKKVKKELEDNGLDFSKDFGTSLFEELVGAFEEDASKQQFIKMLDIQYRMPKQVGSLISKYFYHGKLKNPSEVVVPNYDATKKHGLNLKQETSILFISTSNEKHPYDNDDKFKRSNSCNVEKIKGILEDLNVLYADNLQKTRPFTIGVIAGYRGQVELLKKSINRSEYANFVQKKEDGLGRSQTQHLISINTVDKFQGAERDIIIYDVVRSSLGQSNIGFLDDYRRINVAFSRVKRLLIVVGDSDYLIQRARLNPNSKFKQFKLQQIAKELKEQGYVFDTIKEAIQ